MLNQISTQNKKLIPYLLLVYLLPLTFLFTVAFASIQTGVAVRTLTSDPADIANIHPLVGIVSNCGILLWAAASAICFSALPQSDSSTETRKWHNFFCILAA